MTRPIVLIGYSHKDEQEKEQLLAQLKDLQQASLIDQWSDERIGDGADWEAEIGRAMAQARVAILLISANFLSSDFMLRQEVPQLLKRRRGQGLIVFPVIAKTCNWRSVKWLTQMQVRPEGGIPIWPGVDSHVDEGLAEIAQEIASIVRESQERDAELPAPQILLEARQRIDNPEGVSLPAEVRNILSLMFPVETHQRVVLKAEFRGGLSGSRVFLVYPIKKDGRRELPSVAKIGPQGLIKAEWDAYQQHIRNHWRSVAEIKGQPVYLATSGAESSWGGLRYPLVGESGTDELESLHSYFRRHEAAEIQTLLEDRLFKKIGENWRFSRAVAEFSMQAGYDRLLPVNLMIRPEPAPAETEVQRLEPDNISARSLAAGDYIRLTGFEITEVDPPKQEVTLNLPRVEEGPPASFRLRLHPVETIEVYEVGRRVVFPIEGVVTATRQQLLLAEARKALGSDVDLEAETVGWGDEITLPNPLVALAGTKWVFRNVKIASIHGDMNMENILVNRATGDVSLIDFATAREDHALHDLLRLETEVVTKLIPETLAGADLSPETIHPFYLQLHQATFPADLQAAVRLPHPDLEKPFAVLTIIRREARKCFFNLDDSTEYYQGLILYLLGALKFKNLDAIPQAKPVAFWGAATLAALLDPVSEQGEPVPVTIGSADEVSQSLAISRHRKERLILLDKVKNFWVKGVLEKSLLNANLIELVRQPYNKAIDHPWDRVVDPDVHDSRPIPSARTILDIFRKADRALLILGAPGAGKTTTLIGLARELIRLAEQDPGQPVPVILSLASWAEKRAPLADWVVEELTAKYQIPRQMGRGWLENNDLILLLDGLDEMEASYRADGISTINGFRETYGLTGVVVCSRKTDYESASTRLRLGGAILLRPLTPAQIEAYVAAAGDRLAALRSALQQEAEQGHSTLLHLALSPLMLSIMSLAYGDHDDLDVSPADPAGDPAQEIATGRRHLFTTYVDRMLQRRGVDPTYSPAQTKQWLAWLAQKMLQHNQTVFLIEQIQPSWLPSPGWRWLYLLTISFIYAICIWSAVWTTGLFWRMNAPQLVSQAPIQVARRLQISPGAGQLLLAAIFVIVLGTTFILLNGLHFEFRHRREEKTGPYLNRRWQRATVFGFTAAVVVILTLILLGDPPLVVLFWGTITAIFTGAGAYLHVGDSYRDEIGMVEAIGWSWSGALKGLVVGLIVGLILELAASPVTGRFNGLYAGFWGLNLAFFVGLRGKRLETKSGPNQGAWLSIKNALRVGLLYGAIFGLYVALLWNVSSGLFIVIVGSILVPWLFGGAIITKHFLVRVMLWYCGHLPWNYAHFLDFTAERVLLRKVGGGYVFVHRLLQEFFADFASLVDASTGASGGGTEERVMHRKASIGSQAKYSPRPGA